jgi:uncharacterized protein (TIGR03545 family)
MTEKKEKKIKKQGPIRTGAVVPFIVFVTLIALFNLFLLDRTIKNTIEYIGEQVNGAEVNVANVKTSFSDLKISVYSIQFTDKSNPHLNLLEIGQFDFQLMWDALLRGKFVISLANIEDVKVKTQRKRPGYIVPVEKNKISQGEKVARKTLKRAQKDFEGNVFGDIAGVLSGGSTGDVAKNIEGSLESKKRFERLSQEIENKQKSLEEQMAKLPSGEELKKLERRFNAIAWGDLRNLAKAPQILKQADRLNKDIQAALNSYKNVNDNFQRSLKEISSSYQEAEKLIQTDINSVSKRMNLPTLDKKAIAKMLFGNEIIDKVASTKKYQTIAKKYMPPKKEKPEPIAKPRGEGRDYTFGTPQSYPLFWLKLAKINSKNEQGSVIGKLENVTNNQYATGVLTNAIIKADFPPQNIRNISAKATIDHREAPIMKLEASVGSFVVTDKALSKSADAKFIIKKSEASTNMFGTLREERVDLKIKNRFTKIDYQTEAKSPVVSEVLKDVAKKTNVLTLDAKVKGEWDKLLFDIKSNLASAIENSVRSLIKEKIQATQRKIKADIEKEIARSRSEVDKQITQVKSQVNQKLEQGRAQVKKIKEQIQQKEKKAKESLKNPFKGIKL